MSTKRQLREFAATTLGRLNPWMPHYPTPRLNAPIICACVDRVKNAQHAANVIQQLPSQADIRLHALDKVAPALVDWTIREGPGTRRPLLQCLLNERPVPEGAWVVLFDDDVVFARRGPSNFLDLAAAGGLDVAGPAIAVGQDWPLLHSIARPARLVRQVRFVEVGPIVAFSPMGREKILPFAPSTSMGWGEDVRWASVAAREGLRLGVVDGAPVLHHGQVGGAYDQGEARTMLRSALREAGVSDLHELTVDIGAPWRPWQTCAPWQTP